MPIVNFSTISVNSVMLFLELVICDMQLKYFLFLKKKLVFSAVNK